MLFSYGGNKSIYLSVHSRRILTNVLHNNIIEKLFNVVEIVMTNGLIIFLNHLKVTVIQAD